jgi:tetratricopeptide (TPR) repeat protein
MGIRALQEGRFHQAVAILEATTQLSPDDPEVWLTLARAYRGTGETQKCIAAYQFVLNTRPPDDILAVAQSELEAISHRDKGVIEDALRPACEACGATLPASRAARPWCICGWNTRTPPVIGRQVFLSDLAAYAFSKGAVVAFKRREDVYLVAKHQFRLQGIGTKTYPVDPRLALGIRERMAVILQDELRPIQAEGGDALFRVRPMAQNHGMGKFYSWRQMVAHLSELEGVDVSMRTPDTSLAAVMAAGGVLGAEALERLRKERRPEESVGQALLRLGLASAEAILAGVVGDGRLRPQPVREIADRLGERLVAEGLLERRQLKQALFLQSQFKRPLGDLLIEARLVGPGDVASLLAEQVPPPETLPAADGLGELLVASKLLSRTQLIQLESEMARIGEGDLETFARQRHVVPGDQIDRAVAWRMHKMGLAHQGRDRLGEVLISQRAITSEALGQALMAQVDDPRPLGVLLIASGRVTPEQVIAALEEQDRRRNRQAWKEEEDATVGTRPLDQGSAGPAAFARATTRALTRVLVGDDTPVLPVERAGPEAPSGKRKRRKKKKRRVTPWRLVAFAVVAGFLVAIGTGIIAARARNSVGHSQVR